MRVRFPLPAPVLVPFSFCDPLFRWTFCFSCEQGTTKAFLGTLALQDVDFDVHTGALNVLICESGAGKSTLMKILAGVEKPTLGTIIIADEVISFINTRWGGQGY
ncbi:ATP-binding cassette domain-containing protein [Devosia rhodophyticola]|uniref:ATP-binding cassette domain-containing protein n=1 Tax=Devosia rhodophyticola TaxID=3026423 RepID=A0ABY7YXT1_9HYPH|nr:ATP-binding cassette domain-containing protein [Devosia rhodophyticola]WDR06022.1 ATP-binding cassette domain-containing protein [Devosia rhodophyticola]